MSTFESDLNAHLAGDAAIAAAVGDDIWPNIRPEQSGLPAITTQVVATIPTNDLDGLDGKLLNKRMQIDVWAYDDYDAARWLAELVRMRMQTAAASFASLMLSDQDFFESDTKIHRVSMDFSCWYTVPE